MVNLRSSHKGFSLIEVMVAMVIVATIAIVSARSFVSMKRSEVSLREADICKSYLDSAFKNIDAYGIMPTLVNNTLIATTEALSPAGQNIKGVDATAAFPLHSQIMVNFVDSSHLTKLHTPSMLGGTIAMLNGLYNDHSTSCSTSISGNSAGLMPPPPEEVDASGVTSTMVITPFDISTGLNHDCAATDLKGGSGHILAPKGVTVLHTQATTAVVNSTSVNADLDTNVHNDVGFKVQVTASFKTSDGRSHECNATHNYGYMADLSAPAPPDIHVLTIDNTPTSGDAVRYGPHTVNLSIGYSTTAAKPGVVLMCEDLSQANVDPGDSIFAPNGDDHITAFHPPLGHTFAPCEWVTLCGKSQRGSGGASRASFPTPTSYQHFTMSSTWPNNGINGNANTIPPYGCLPKIGVVAVDMAGNVSSEVYTIPVTPFGARQDCNGGWGACSIPPSNPAACGPTGGIQTYTYNWPSMYGGAVCPYSNGATRACALSNPCPINCVGGFGACSASCAGTYTYTITTPAQYGGSVCPYANGYTTSCNGVCPPAPVNCVGAWGACTGACGSQTEVFSVSVPAANGGAACSATNGASQSCVTPVCAATPTPTPTPPPVTPTPTATPSNCAWVRSASLDKDSVSNIAQNSNATRVLGLLNVLMKKDVPQAGACRTGCGPCSLDHPTDNDGDGVPTSEATKFCDKTDFGASPYNPPPIGTALADSATCNPSFNGVTLPGIYYNWCTCDGIIDHSTWTCQCTAPPAPTPTPTPFVCPSGKCCPGHPMVWYNPVGPTRACSEYASPPGVLIEPGQGAPMNAGQTIHVESGYCATGGNCYGDMDLVCNADGSVSYTNPTCFGGTRP